MILAPLRLGAKIKEYPTWDAAVQAFHDQMVFLWTQYADDDRPLEGEEAEIRDYIKGLTQ